MRLAGSAVKCRSIPIENASVNATNSQVSWRFAFTIVCVFLSGSQSFALPFQSGLVRAHLIKQESVFIGPHELWVSQDALRSIDLNTGITTVVRADHTVVIFNEKKKCFFQARIETMGMDPSVSSYTPFRFALASRQWKKVRELNFCGQPVIVYESVQASGKAKGRWTGLDGMDIYQARYAEAAELKLSSGLLKALEYLYIIPPPKAVPLRVLFNTMHNKGTYKKVLETLSIEEKSVPSAYFSVPKGCKQVFKRADVGDYAKRDAVLESVSDLILEHK